MAQQDDGKRGYEAYRAHTGGISLVSKQPIPEWEALPTEIQEAWIAAADAILFSDVDELDRT